MANKNKCNGKNILGWTSYVKNNFKKIANIYVNFSLLFLSLLIMMIFNKMLIVFAYGSFADIYDNLNRTRDICEVTYGK